MRIAHLSDLHFGRIAHPAIVDAVVEEINGMAVDLVVISGDLTQRARRMQFAAAAAMLEALKPPRLVVPGNHDVYAWWYPFSRLSRPLARYKRLIAADLTPTFEREGLAVLGINSAYGRTIKGGRITRKAQGAVRTFFQAQQPATFKVLVVHHHLTRIQALGPHDVARKAKQTLATAAEAGVDLILCGHLHISHVEHLDIVPAQHRIVVASAGTATSSRGRHSNRNTNFYNIIDIDAAHFTIEERRFDLDEQVFVTDDVARFDRVVPGTP